MALTIGDRSEPPPESQLSRLRRLQAEVAQLEREMHTSPAPLRGDSAKRKSVLPPRQSVDIVAELSALRERLSTASETAEAPSDRRDVATRLTQLEVAPEKAPPPPPSSQVGHVGEVDKRLAVLERAVGVTDTDSENVSSSQGPL